MLAYLFSKTPLIFFVQNLWRDEAFSFVMAHKTIGEILSLTVGDFSPPFYYIVLHYWMMIFGTSEIALRSLSLVCFAGTIYIIFDILRQVFKLRLSRAILGILLIAVNPFLVYYAFEARMYMMVTFFVTISYYALWTKRRNLYVASITLALYTHYFSVFILFIQFLSFLFQNSKISKNFLQKPTLWQNIRTIFTDKREKVKKLANQFSYFILPGALFLPWVLFLRMQHNFVEQEFWVIQPPLKDLLYTPFVLYTGYERVFGEYYHDAAGYTQFHSQIAILLWIIVALFISLLIKTAIRRPVLFDLMLWAFFTPYALFALSYTYQPLYLPRYFIVAVPGFLILLLVSLDHISRLRIFHRFSGLMVASILVLFLIVFTQKFSTLNLKYHHKRTVRAMYQEISALKKEKDAIYLTSVLDYHLAQYYLGLDSNIYLYDESYENIPQYVGKVLIPEDRIIHFIPNYPNRAFVVFYNWYEIRSTL